MINSTLKQLAAAKAKVAKLEDEIAHGLKKSLMALPAEHGFEDMKAFIAALKAAGRSGVRRGNKALKRAAKRTRAKITPAIRRQVKQLVKAGKSGGEIAEKVGISLPSVQNIKKALGLVKTRGAKKPAKRARTEAAKAASASNPSPPSPATQT